MKMPPQTSKKAFFVFSQNKRKFLSISKKKCILETVSSTLNVENLGAKECIENEKKIAA